MARSRSRRPTRSARARLALAALAPITLGALAGCGSHGHVSRREVALERAQFVQVTSELREVQGAVRREVSTSRAVWPSIYNGLPRRIAPRLLVGVKAASSVAGGLPAPRFMAKRATLTGPASGVAGLYEDYDRLVERGWRLTETTVNAIAFGSRPVARFVRANSPLYIDAIYDGHFDLSLLGERVLKGYEKLVKLGASANLPDRGAFGSRLTRAEVMQLVGFYSIPGVRLEPHPGPTTNEG